MSAGIKAWDTAGRLILDFTDRVTKQVQGGSITFPAGVNSAVVPVSGLASNEDWMVVTSSGFYVQYGVGSFTMLRSGTWGSVGFDITVTYAVLRR